MQFFLPSFTSNGSNQSYVYQWNSNRPLFALHRTPTARSSPFILVTPKGTTILHRAFLVRGRSFALELCIPWEVAPTLVTSFRSFHLFGSCVSAQLRKWVSEVIKMQHTAPDMVSCDVFKTLILMSFPQLCVLHLSHSFRRV